MASSKLSQADQHGKLGSHYFLAHWPVFENSLQTGVGRLQDQLFPGVQL